MSRLRDAFNTNDTQASTVCLLTFLNLCACGAGEHNTNWIVWVIALLFWPMLALLFNFFDPIKKSK
jgi:hypothetical protein